jgi:hypothetical protein
MSKQGNHVGQHHYSRRGATSCNYTNSNDSGGSEEGRSAHRISDKPNTTSNKRKYARDSEVELNLVTERLQQPRRRGYQLQQQ